MKWINHLSQQFIQNVKVNNNYRNFRKLQNVTPPFSIYEGRKIINWSNNDYNGLSHNPEIKRTLINGVSKYGCGSGGTRNIGGTNEIHTTLESKISSLHNKDAGLVFNSGYLANLSCMQAFGNIFPNAEIFSDEYNHSSIINGIKLSNLPKSVFKHNDSADLEILIKQRAKYNTQKIIVIESIYSIDGSIAPFDDIIAIAKEYNAMIFVDEIHGVGVHGKRGGGITDLYNHQSNIDIIMGGFGKGYGLMGGYLTGDRMLIDAIRLCGSGFIFTTSLPPHFVSGIIESIDNNLKTVNKEQEKRKKLIYFFKNLAHKKKIPLIENNFKYSQIQSIHIGCSLKAEKIHNLLLCESNHYVQHLNFPTVPKGNERLRISLKSCHNELMISNLLDKIEKALFKLGHFKCETG